MYNKVPSQTSLAKIAGVDQLVVRRNVLLLLKMVLKNGYSLKKDIAEKMNNNFLEKKWENFYK